MRVVNTDQAEAWNGPEGANWAEQSERDDPVNSALTELLLGAAAIGPQDRVLDIGCGTGETTRRAAQRASSGEALGIDLSALMLDHARSAATSAGITNVTFEQGDAQAYAFPAAAFDVAISQFGMMFFADPLAAFANIRGALRPGGRLAFVCPRGMADNAWYVAPISALLNQPSVAEPPESAAGLLTATAGLPEPAAELPESAMFSLADPARLTEVLSGAGFTGIRAEPVDVPMAFGPDAGAAADGFLGSGPVLAILQRDDGPSAEAARQILIEALRPYEGPGGVRIPGAHWLVTAIRPDDR